MAVILDASWAAAFIFEDEGGPEAEALYAGALREGVVVPAIWPLEIANILRQGERRGRIPASNVAPTIARLLAIPCRVEPTPVEAALGPILDLARKHALTSYDASYLWLAMTLGLAPATRDLPLAAAARAEGVGLVAV